MKEPLTGYPLPDEAYTEPWEHVCILPEIIRTRQLPIGTRWQCGDCKTVHEVVAVSLGRMWKIADLTVCGTALGSSGLDVRCQLPPHGPQLLHESSQPDGQLRRWSDNESE